MIRLRLYTTLGCHLCEQLEAVLAMLCAPEYHLERVEISEDDALVARYGARLPVLVDEAGQELDRDMEPDGLAGWLASRGWLDETAWQQLQGPRSGEAAPDIVKGAEIRGGRRYLG